MNESVISVSGGPVWLAELTGAAQEVVARNVVPGRSPDEPKRYLRAGGGYADPWTRDAAVNAWQAGCWLFPEITGSTLEMVCDNQNGVVWDTQWWDQSIWIIGSWFQGVVARDLDWVGYTYLVGRTTLSRQERHGFDQDAGLFRGPAFIADGISGYPRSLHDPNLDHESFVLDHEQTLGVYSLSTNVIMAWSNRVLAEAARLCGDDPDPWQRRADELTSGIRSAFHLADGRWASLISPVYDQSSASSDGIRSADQSHGDQSSAGTTAIILNGKKYLAHCYVEAAGFALLVLAGIVSGEQAHSVVAQVGRTRAGVVAVYPHFAGFDDQHFGRHNVACWPVITGLVAQAGAMSGNAALFASDLQSFAKLIMGSQNEFFEVYHPVTARPDGGWQAERSWRSEPDQTWSATAFLGTLLYGLLGLRPQWDGLRFDPLVPPGFDQVEVSALPWRGARLTVGLHGSGRLNRLVVDGITVEGDLITQDLVGHHLVELHCVEQP